MALDENGNLWGCGSNEYGQVGFGVQKEVKILSKIGDIKFVDIDCREHYTLAIDESGSLWGCGFNKSGQLGLGDKVDRHILTKIPTFKSLKCGRAHALAIWEDGCTLLEMACGNNKFGQLGVWDGVNRRIFEKVLDIPIKKVCCLHYKTIALSEDRILWVCGNNFYVN